MVLEVQGTSLGTVMLRAMSHGFGLCIPSLVMNIVLYLYHYQAKPLSTFLQSHFETTDSQMNIAYKTLSFNIWKNLAQDTQGCSR